MYALFSKLNKNIYAKIALGALIGAFVILGCLCISIKYFISYSFIEKKINDLTGLRVEFVGAESNFNYRFNLDTKAKEINIYNSDKTAKFGVLNNPDITLKPFGFIFGRAYFKNISADNIEINIKRDHCGKIDLFEALNKDLGDILKNQKITLTRLDSDIKNINITFEDNYKTQSRVKFSSKDTKINLSKRKKTFSLNQIATIETNSDKNSQIANLKLKIDSKYPFNKIDSKDLKTDIILDGVNLVIFNDFIKKYLSNQINTVDIKTNLTLKTDSEGTQRLSLKIFNPTLKLTDEKIISPYKDGVGISGIFGVNKNKINLEDIKIEAKNLLIKTRGEISSISAKKPDIDLDIDIENSQLNNIIPFLPDNLIYYNPKGIPTLKKSNFFALANAKLKAKLFPLNIEGDLKLQDVHISTYPKPYKQNDVNIRFLGDKARIYTRIYTPDNEYILLDGISNLDNSLYGKYSVKSTSKIDLKFAQLYLVPLQQIIGFNIGPVPIMDITGFGNININTQGTVSDAQIFGTFSAYNATAKMKGLYSGLKDGKCTLIFDNRDLIFKEIKGKLDDSDFIMTGKGNTKGDVSLDIKIENAKTGKILKIFNNSLISKPYLPLTSQIAAASGDFGANLNLSGTIKDYEDESFLQTLTPKGTIALKDNKIILNNGFLLDKLSGILNFGSQQDGQIRFNVKNSTFGAEFISKTSLDKISKGEKFDVQSTFFSNKISSKDIIGALLELKTLNDTQKTLLGADDLNFYSKLYLKSKGEASISDFKPENFKHDGYLIGLNSTDTPNVKFVSGIAKINNNKITLDNFEINVKEGKIKAKGSVNNALSKKPSGDLIVWLNNIKLDQINKIIPNIKVQDAFIKNGQIIFKNDNLRLNSLSLDYASMPVFLNANLKNIHEQKLFSADFSTIINEQAADNIINPYLISPVKITGEIPLKGSFRGDIDDYSIDFSASVPRNSDISFNGANLGDINHKRELEGKIDVSKNTAKIHNLKLIKFIANQNNKINPITALKINGAVVQKDNSFFYDNLKIATNTPINVRILNLIFKKSLLKKGNFDCNISLKGNIKLPAINGKINLYDLDIPLYDTKIDNIKINISDKFIDSEILAKNKQSDMKVNIHALNKLDSPYIIKNFNVLSNNLNINNILNSISPAQSKTDIQPKAEFAIKPDDIVIENGEFEFREVSYEKISAQNLKGKLSYKNGIAEFKDVITDIAKGTITSWGKYDLKTTKLSLQAMMNDCDSAILAKYFLNLSNQIYGKINGSLTLSAKNLNTPQGINNIKSNIDFSVDNGKMPKLGSLEYLLRAGNLFKNGILGLSLNNIIEVLTPYKTGEFEKISGNLAINNAKIENLNIFSQGKNLSLFLEGNYDILENYADINIYGKLSKTISNALGAIGNASISQFVDTMIQKRNKNEKDEKLKESLDKIPPIETEVKEPVYFRAKVSGDINKENYIKSFTWL